MKVHGLSRPNVSPVRDTGHVKGGRGNATEATKATSGERGKVSSLSTLVSQVRESAPDALDADKVERLRDSIRTGVFKVDRQKIAEAMLEEEV
jgi:flagellar biosynthesis anti-sigma factor FlgM